MTVAELRKLLEAYPDDMPVRAYSERNDEYYAPSLETKDVAVDGEGRFWMVWERRDLPKTAILTLE